MNEQELTALLERGAQDLAPDIDRLVGGGAARGRRSVRRRRVGVGVAAVAVVGAVGIGAVVLPGSDGGRATDGATQVASTASPTPTARTRVVDTDDNGPVEVNAELRPIAEIHADIQRMLGPGASDLLQGPSAPMTRLHGDDLSWFFRFDDAEAQVSVHPFPTGCTPSGEQVAHQTGCLETDAGVEYRTAGPFSINSYGHPDQGRWQQTVVSWQHGFEIMVISTNVHQEITNDAVTTTRVADDPTITMDELVALATSDIWFEAP
jgi:hypothetical protein